VANLLNEQRQVYVWLPPGYIRTSDTQFPVLYLLNGGGGRCGTDRSVSVIAVA